ncbi:hypothetical protein AJ79_08225 [Helicocarpus griseus UAMH5409]|uniref:Uncharacterized protein n=1 Tax=Helicocarpus griseus UAMH5409 TaxID=1447875 RepID=A0A2B7WUW3_9EURO|nr:hypothetical protein AJ79_08225 [Helicocarpus griseus UAMH5409]
MSGLQQCLPAHAATRLRLASGALGREGSIGGLVLTSRLGVWSYSNRLATKAAGHDYTLQLKRSLSYDGRVGTGAAPSSVTWFTPEPGRVALSDIISQLPVLPSRQDVSHNIPLFLVTPAFAPWVVKSNTFLRDSIAHIFQNETLGYLGGDKSFYSVAAVVDKLPAPDKSSPGPNQQKLNNELAAVGQHGLEGISLYFANRDALAGEVVKSIQKRDMSTPEAEPALSCLFQVPTTANSSAPAFAEIGIRIANTLFVNGKARTMLASRWRHDADSAKLALDKEYNLVRCQIRCANKPRAVTACVPLQPVTKPREIVSSMGNILRQLSKGDRSGAAIPASAELEKALPAYIKEHNIENQRIAVWALVQPKTSENESPTPCNTLGDSVDPFLAVNNGARLHRVVSGGGGWGKKQGLLSLDPEYSYETEDKPTSGQLRPVYELFETHNTEARDQDEMMSSFLDELPGSIQFKDGQFTTDLSEIAKPGDTVQFLVAPLDNPQAASVAEAPANVEGKRATQFSFGVIPSSDADWSVVEQAVDVGQVSSPSSSGGIAPTHNHFGALSEKGLTYSVFAEGSLRGGRDGEQRQLVLGTKIDVPGSKIVVDE